ncbi:MAG: hypothetical protein EBT55_01905 [Proteobacteria bacterium]|nr:hypothetical protein [Pseudomonadota bacterium]
MKYHQVISIIKQQINNLVSKLKTSNIFSKKIPHLKIFIALAVLLLVVFLLFISSLFFDNTYLQNKISTHTSKIINANFVVKGGVKAQIIPTPKIILSDVFIENYRYADNIYNLYAKKITISFGVDYFFSKHKIKKITLENALLESNHHSLSIENTELKKISQEFVNIALPTANKKAFTAKLFNIDKIDAGNLKLNNIEFIDIHFLQYNKFGVQQDLENINFNFHLSQKKIELYGNLNNNNTTYNLDLLFLFNPKKNSYLKINSDAFNLAVDGNFLEKNDNQPLFNKLLGKFQGNLTAEIVNFKNFYQLLFGNHDILAPNLKNNIKSIKLNTTLENDGSEIVAKNIKIDSLSASGNAEINIGIDQKISFLDIKINLNDLDLNEFLLPKEESEEKITEETFNNQAPIIGLEDNEDIILLSENKNIINLENKESLLNNYIKKSNKFDIITEIQVKNIKFYESTIKDFEFYSLASSGNAIISPIKFNIDDNNFYIAGIVDNTESYPKFIGKMSGNGSSIDKGLKNIQLNFPNININDNLSYKFNSDVIFTPSYKILNRFYLVLNNGESEIYSNIKAIGFDKNRVFKAQINFSKFDLSKYISLSKDNSYFNFGKMFDKTLWLNKISGDYNIKLKFDELIYRNQKFNNQSFDFSFKKGFLQLNNSQFNNDENNFNAELALNLAKDKPTIDLKISGEKMSINSTANKDNTKNLNYDFVDNFYKLASLEGFNGQLNINLNNLQFYQDKLSNLKATATMQDGQIIFTNLTSNLHQGNFEFKGDINMKLNKIISGTFSCKSCYLDSITKHYFQINNISGITNIEGNIISVASKKQEVFQNTALQIAINSNSPQIAGYGLSDLINTMVNKKSTLKNPEQILENQQAITKYKQASGFISIIDGNTGNFSFKLQETGLNSVFSGKINTNKGTINGSLNSIFLIDNNQKNMPINIITNIAGKINDFSYISNLNQVRQYLGLEKISKEILETKFNQQFTEKQQQQNRIDILNSTEKSVILEETKP